MGDQFTCESGIYEIRNKANGKVYIGSAVCLRNRLKKHKGDLRAGVHHSQKLQHAWVKYGEGSFEFSVIEYAQKDKLIEREQHWIDNIQAVKNGYNICPTAGSILGVKRSEETKQKMSISLKRIPGKALSEEHKRKISAANKGRVKSAEWRKNLSDSLFGKTKSEEHRRKLSSAVTGFKHTEETKLKISRGAKGRIKSAEECSQISARQKGIKRGPQSPEMIANRVAGWHRARLSRMTTAAEG